VIFGFMMIQVLVIIILQPFKNTMIGNHIFWLGMIFGVPLIASLYLF